MERRVECRIGVGKRVNNVTNGVVFVCMCLSVSTNFFSIYFGAVCECAFALWLGIIFDNDHFMPSDTERIFGLVSVGVQVKHFGLIEMSGARMKEKTIGCSVARAPARPLPPLSTDQMV